MPLPTETMEERFKAKFAGYSFKRKNDIWNFTKQELFLSQNRILEEVEKLRYKVYEHTDSMFINGHTQALEDIIKLISKKDN